jgi:hypothetical protein
MLMVETDLLRALFGLNNRTESFILQSMPGRRTAASDV